MSCPVCGSTKNSKKIEFNDTGLFSYQGKVTLQSCSDCELQFNPKAMDITPGMMKAYYQGGISWEKRKAELLLSLGGYQKTYVTYRDFVTDALKHKSFPSLDKLCGIDIGGGAGEFCFYAKQEGFNTELLDFSEQRLRFAHEILGIEKTHSQLPEKKFDLIWLLQVIEHVANPVEYLTSILQRCARSGSLVMLATPNTNSLGAKLFGTNWKHYNPHHISLFNSKSIMALLRTCNLELVALDERRMYATGRTSEIKSLIGSMRRQNPKSLSTDGLCVLARVK
jgi:2-polyprenyl-3-methyl-5-hydroxy-6-metoxy-1,4-benzoquinol methylase